MTSRRRLATALLMSLASGSRAALAQEIPPEQAAALVEPRLPAVLERAPPNQAVAWSDEASGLSGTISAAEPSFPGRLMCRAIRYVVQGASQSLSVEGERCRRPEGSWGPGRVADRIVQAPAATPLIRDLQAAMRRLAYYDGPVDGIANDPLGRALLAFEHDEQAPPDAQPSPGLLELAGEAIGRIPAAGSCAAVPEGWSAACGTAR